MLRDLRLAVRSLKTWRVGALAAMLTLAIGIGTTTAFYALLRAVLADSAIDIEEVERVVRLYGASPTLGVQRSPVTLDDVEFTLSRTRAFEAVAAYESLEIVMETGGGSERLTVTRVSPDFFAVLGGHPAEGRLLAPADYSDTTPRAVVSAATWRRRFTGRRLADAPTIRLDGRDYTVAGVLPPAFSFPFIGITGDVWVPLSRSDVAGPAHVSAIARLARTSSWTSAAAELAALPPPLQAEGAWRWRAIPVQDDTRARRTGGTIWVLLPAVVVLIAGCVNVACMLLARGIRRETEFSVRMALGATRATIFRQLLFENGVIAFGAGVAGAAVAALGIEAVGRVLADTKPVAMASLAEGAGLFRIALVSSAAASLIFGVVPALSLARRDLAATLKGSAPPPRVRVAGYGARDLVVFAELSLAVVLVVFTAMSFAVVRLLQDTRVGFAVEELVATRVPARQAPAAVERVRALPGVTSVAVASTVPGGSRSAGMATAAGGPATPVSIVDVGEGFFASAGLPIVRGRAFGPNEGAGAAVTVIGERGAAALWPGHDAIGKTVDIVLRGRPARLVVIGVARDATQMAIPGARAAEMYVPLDAAHTPQLVLLARSPRAKEIARAVVSAARPGDAVAASDARPLSETFGAVSSQSVGMMKVFAAFSVVALLLAGSGIYAVVSQSVTERTSEFGVRLALGATRGRVLRMVLAREFRLIAAALAAGSIGTVALIRSSGFDDAAFIVAVSASRPEWALMLIGLCGAVAVAACGIATYRIVKLDPWAVLRRL